mgnify:CR=1 FL=1
MPLLVERASGVAAARFLAFGLREERVDEADVNAANPAEVNAAVNAM